MECFPKALANESRSKYAARCFIWNDENPSDEAKYYTYATQTRICMTHAQHAEFRTLAGKGTIGKVRVTLTARNDNIWKRFNIVSKARDQTADSQARKKARANPATSNRDKAVKNSCRAKLQDPIKSAEAAKKAAQVASDAAFAVVIVKKNRLRSVCARNLHGIN
jgi:hypothetical protein